MRWAEGVAVRGKLKGKTQPVVDCKLKLDAPSQMLETVAKPYSAEALSTSRAILDQSRAAVRTEAAQHGFAPLILKGEETDVGAIRLRVIDYCKFLTP